jgi:hypothetical protein
VGAWYPHRDRFFVAELNVGRPVFQGDVFRGLPTAFLAHPAAREAVFASEPQPSPAEAERPLTATDVRESAVIDGEYSMLLPHPCDFSDEEKGSTHTTRIVARLRRVRDTGFSRKAVASGRVHHTIWVPAWDSDRPDDDWLVDLRSTTSVDRAYLNPARRVVALSGPAWIAAMRRLALFYTRLAIDDVQLAVQQAHNHPDYAALG